MISKPSASALSRLLFLVLAAALASACASESDLTDLRREQRQISRRLADTRADLESLRLTVNRLQGKVDDISGGRGGRSALPQQDVESRLRNLEETVGQPREPSGSPATEPPGSPPIAPNGGGEPSNAPPAAAVVAGAPPPAGAPAGAVVAPGADDVPRSVDIQKDLSRGGSDQYREGLQSYQRGDYPKAVQSLRGFVNKEPKNDLVPSAQYWIGEAYFAQHRYNEAILAYNEILIGWPKSERVPAALLRQGVAFAELGDKIDARLILQKLIADHPGTEEAASAKRKLLTLGA